MAVPTEIPFFLEPLFFFTMIILASLYVLFKGADYLVDGIRSYAKKLGLSGYIIGLVVIAMAASAPEIMSSLMGYFMGEESIFLGAIIGTNMVHGALAVGLLAIVGKKVKLEFKVFEKARFLIWFCILVPFVLMSDGLLSRADGFILLSIFFFYLVILWKKEGTLGKLKKKVKLKKLWRDGAIFCGALIAILLASQLLVLSATNISYLYKIPPYFAAITLIAIGATIPDIAVSLQSLLKGDEEIGVGEILGSVLIELLFFFGLIAIISPITVDVQSIITAAIFFLTAMAFVLYLTKRGSMNYLHGIVLVLIYIAFLSVEIYRFTVGF